MAARRPPPKKAPPLNLFDPSVAAHLAPGKGARQPPARNYPPVSQKGSYVMQPGRVTPRKKGFELGVDVTPSRSVPKPPTETQKAATIWVAGHTVLPFEVQHTPPPKKAKPLGAPYRPGYVPPPTEKGKQAFIDKRFHAAEKVLAAAPDAGKAKKTLIQTMSPAEKKEILQRGQSYVGTPDTNIAKEFEKLNTSDKWYPHPTDLLAMGDVALTAGKDIARTVATPIERRGLGLAASTYDAITALQNRNAGRLAAPAPPQGGLGGGAEAAVRSIGVEPTPTDFRNLGIDVALGIAKANVGGVVGIAGVVTHPRQALHQFTQMARGAGAAITALSVIWMLPKRQRDQVIQQTIGAAFQQILDMYGPDASWGDVAHGAYREQQLLYFINGVALWAPELKLAGIARLWKGGATLREANILMRDPSRIGEFPEIDPRLVAGPRTLTVRGENIDPYTVDAPQARHPFGRTVQKGYDVATGAAESIPGVGPKLPFRQSKRALRIQARQQRREVQRLMAEAAALWSEVKAYTDQVPEHGPRLFHSLQRPSDIPEDVWLNALMSEIRMNLTFEGPTGRRPSPTEAKLQRKLGQLKTRVDQATRTKWLQKVADVHTEETRLSHLVATLNDSLKSMRERVRLIEASTDFPSDVEKGRALRRAQDDVVTLETRREEAQAQYDELTVDQPPIEDPIRTELIDAIRQAPLISDREAWGLMQVLDARARIWGRQTGRDPAGWYSDPNGLGLSEIHWIEDMADLPEGALAQIRPVGGLKRGTRPGAAEENLRLKPGGDKHEPLTAIPENKPGKRTVNGVRGIVVFGRVTPEQWLQRVLAVVKDKAERDTLARWYERAAPTFERFFGDDAEKILRGFAVSQANVSPAGGLLAVLKVFDKMNRGAPVTKGEIITVVESIRDAMGDEVVVTEGLAAKLHDFADSLEGKQTRTWMGNDPRGGRPATGDVHAGRDFGKVDKKIVGRLTNPSPRAMWKGGFNRDKITVDGGEGNYTGHAYERISEFYNEVADYLNELDNGKGFDGRADWTPAEVQALGWSVYQRLHGMDPEDIPFAVGENARRISLEVTKGRSGRGNNLTLAEAETIASAMIEPVRAIVEAAEGLYLQRDITIGIDAYQGTTNAALHFEVAGGPRATWDLTVRLGEIFNQWDVWATRVSSSNAVRTVTIAHPDMVDPNVAVKVYEELYAQDPVKFAGFTSTELNGQPAISIVLGKHKAPVTKEKYNDEAAQMRAEINEALNRSLSDANDASMALSNTQVIDKEWKHGGKSKYPAVPRTRAQRALDDSLATQAKARLDEAYGAVGGARFQALGGSGHTPPEFLSQTRENELKGAVQFLNSEDGQRILYLTESADVSTILHELIGHGVREMKTHYPDEFAEVERVIGRPLPEWTVDDHERFARMTERYFETGKAPNPELVETFGHLQVWMRAVRSEAERRANVPIEVSNLLDNYLGAYDSETVFRVATVNTRIPSDVAVGSRQAVYEFTSSELAALRRRNDARAYKHSIEKLENDTRRLSEIENRTEEQELRLGELIAQLREMQGERQIQIVDRENNLRARYKEIEDALATPTAEGYDVALANLQTLITMREDILRSVFGDKYDTVFEKRVDLLADYLADEGLIPPGFARGTAYFVPHRPVGGGKKARNVATPARALESPVIGKTDTSLLGLNRRNNLIRWQNGDIEADPLVVFEAWQNAQAFAFVDQIKKLMWDIGTPIDPLKAIPANVYIINRKGIPIPTLIRRQMPPGTSSDVQRAVDAIEGRNPDAIERTLTKYIGEIIMDPEGAAELIGEMGHDFAQLELRAVDKKIIDAIFRPLRGGGGGFSRGFDYANSLARWSLIYSNPAYIPFNLIANGIFLTAQGGPMLIYDAVTAARFLIRDAKMQKRVGGQIGHIQAEAMQQTGRGMERFKAAEQKGLNIITAIPDKWPRMVAWVAEARRMGYKSKADMNRLLDGDTDTTRRARGIVSDRATQIMVDFDRMGDWERQNVTRVLFIWPWIRGATAWPFYYMREYPTASGLALNVGAATDERRRRIMGFSDKQWALWQRLTPEQRRARADEFVTSGDVRPFYREFFPVERQGHFVQEMNLGSLSPTSTAVQSIEATIGNIESLLGGGNVDAGGRIIDFMTPIYELLGHAAMGISGTGRTDQSIGSNLFDDILQFVPTGGPFWRQVIDPSKRSKIYNDRSTGGIAERRFLRIPVQTVDLDRLNAFRKSEGKKSGEEAVQETVAELTKQAKAYNMEGPAGDAVRALRIQQAIRDERDRRQKELADIPGRYRPGGAAKLTDTEEAMVIYNVLLTFYPGVIGKMAAPTELRKEVRLPYAEALLYGNAKTPIKVGVLKPLEDWRRELSKRKRLKKDKALFPGG